MIKPISIVDTPGLPKSRQIVNHIIDALKDGELKPLDGLPAERQLAEEVKVTRDVIRSAYHKLEILGFITVLGSKGRQVSKEALENLTYYEKNKDKFNRKKK